VVDHAADRPDDPGTPALAEEDGISINGGAGNDRLVAGFLPNLPRSPPSNPPARAADKLTLIGGTGNDRIVGSRFADTIDSGSDNDIVTGSEGVDIFTDPSGNDALLEARNLNFSLSGYTDGRRSAGFAGQSRNAGGSERSRGHLRLDRFTLAAPGRTFFSERFHARSALRRHRGQRQLLLALTGVLSGASSVYVVDTGTGSTDNDTVAIGGGDGNDAIHLDADTSIQQLVHNTTASSFTLSYHGETTAVITSDDSAAGVAAKLEVLNGITDVTVTGTGTASDPWMINILSAAGNVEGKFFRITSSDDTIATAKVARSMVTRVAPDMVDALLAGKPDLEALFSQPANLTQLFNFWQGQTGTFQLTYQGQTTAPLPPLSNASTAAQVKAALENLSTIGSGNVEVTGTGTSRDPWRVSLNGAAKDSRGNYFLLTVDNTTAVTPPADLADAAATTRQSISLNTPANYQRVYYDFSAEYVVIHGNGGSDTFILDDSMAALRA
jgi:hypothetical protein